MEIRGKSGVFVDNFVGLWKTLATCGKVEMEFRTKVDLFDWRDAVVFVDGVELIFGNGFRGIVFINNFVIVGIIAFFADEIEGGFLIPSCEVGDKKAKIRFTSRAIAVIDKE